jgi:hypothetical protein
MFYLCSIGAPAPRCPRSSKLSASVPSPEARAGSLSAPGSPQAIGSSDIRAQSLFMQSDWFHNDALFFEELRKGHRAAELVAHALRERELRVLVTPLEIRERIEDRHEFADEHDLLVGAKNPCRIDVKSRGLHFEGPSDYPYDTALVDTVAGWRQKTHRPVAIVLVSKPTGGMAVIRRSGGCDWRSRRRYDRRRQIEDDFLEVARRRAGHLRGARRLALRAGALMRSPIRRQTSVFTSCDNIVVQNDLRCSVNASGRETERDQAPMCDQPRITRRERERAVASGRPFSGATRGLLRGSPLSGRAG